MNDISRRARIFRSKLIEEFHLVENHVSSLKSELPKYSTTDILSEEGLLDSILTENPNSLIKFKIFKRSADVVRKATKKDRRLLLVRNRDSPPIGVWANHISNHPWFMNFITLLIFVNAIILGVLTSLDSENYWRTKEILNQLDLCILEIFVVEILIKFIDSFYGFWKDPWNIFDFVITIASLIPELIVLVTLDSVNSQVIAVGATASRLRVLRTLRALKMLTRFQSLRTIVRTIMDAFQSMGFILLLLLLLMYMFAIFGVNLFTDYTASKNPDLQFTYKFRNVGFSFTSLFQLLTLDQWYAIAHEVRSESSEFATLTFFIIWVMLGAFIFRNIFVGVMVRYFQNITREMEDQDEETRKKERVERHMKDLQKTMVRSASFVLSENSLALIEDEEKKNNSPYESARALTKKTKDPDLWHREVENVLATLKDSRSETLWHRDTLFEYLQSLEKLQENMKEYQELQGLAAEALFKIYDS
eukprot:g879.t1